MEDINKKELAEKLAELKAQTIQEDRKNFEILVAMKKSLLNADAKNPGDRETLDATTTAVMWAVSMLKHAYPYLRNKENKNV